MKTKKLRKKLTLNKNTIANLMTTDMKKIHGGIGVTIIPNSQCTELPNCSVDTCNSLCCTLIVMCF